MIPLCARERNGPGDPAWSSGLGIPPEAGPAERAYRGRVTPPTALVDPFARRVRDLRLSVTDRCNFRCTYCMPEEGLQWLDRSELLTYEELARIARVCVDRWG